MQRALMYFNEIMCSNIHFYDSINLMTGLFYTGFIKTTVTVRTALAVRMHVILRMIRADCDRKMGTIMTFLRPLLFSGGLAKASVFFHRWLLKSV